MRISPHDAPRLVGFGLLAGLVLAGAGAAVAAAPALAHDTVVSSSPYNGEVVTKPIDTVTVSFSDALMALGAGSPAAGSTAGGSTAGGSGGVAGSATSSPVGFAIQVTDADGGHHESGCVIVNGSDATTSVALGEAGEYDVTWRVVSDDGHPVSGTYSFLWQPTAVTVAAPAYDAAPACGAVWSGAAASGGVGRATGSPGDESTGQTNQTGEAGSTAQLGESGQSGQAGSSATSTIEPEPTMTILSAVPADSNQDQGLALPIAIVAGIAALAALAVVVVTVFRRSRTGR